MRPHLQGQAGTSTSARNSSLSPEAAASSQGVAKEAWSLIAPGIEMRRFMWDDGGHRAPVVALRVAPERLQVAVGSSGQALEAPAWRAQAQALAAVNGGFFDAQGRSLGVRLSQGRLISKPHGSRWSVFRVKKAGEPSGSEAKIVSATEFSAALGRGVRYESAVQCGPLLAKQGQLGTFKDQWDRRTGLGIDAQGRVIVAACNDVLSLRGWALCFVRGLGCPDALNLDGGSSTQMSLKAGSASLEWPGGRGVPDAVVIQ